MAVKNVRTKKQTHPRTAEDRLTEAAEALADYAHRPTGWMESMNSLANGLDSFKDKRPGQPNPSGSEKL